MHPKLKETLSKYETIILVGGGTGGHIQPILSVAKELEDKELLWIGGRKSNEENEAEMAGIPFESIPTLKLSTTRSPKALLYPFFLVRGIYEAKRILRSVMSTEFSAPVKTTRHLAQEEYNEDFSLRSTSLEMTGNICVFSKGGPGSVAVGIAAWMLYIPLYIHESDTIPGRSNRLFGKIATKIFLGFASAKKYFDTKKCEVIGQILHPVFGVPLSRGMASYEPGGLFSEKLAQNPSALSGTSPGQGSVNWRTNKPHIFVICGSQGAKSIFESIIEQFKENNPYEWIIALGKLNSDMKKDFEKIVGMQAVEWLSQENIAHLLTSTDIAITRGSATTLAEIDTFGVKKVIIPLPYAADNHQYWNAKEYEKMGDILLEQKNSSQLKDHLQSII